MVRNDLMIQAPPDAVWAVLADGASFPEWVMGCQGVRHVEGDWPAPGSAIHHRVGVGPATLDDTTSVEEAEPERMLVLRARARPFGVARVRLVLEPEAAGTRVTMEEGVVAGAPKAVDVLTAPLLHGRNAESLRRLRKAVERRRSA